MAKRLIDQYPIGAQVEIYFQVLNQWFPGVIVRHDHPAIWVKTDDGRLWFVTNSRRVRQIA